jgi:hypothetical protein
MRPWHRAAGPCGHRFTGAGDERMGERTRIAYLILAHKLPGHLVRLVRRLDTAGASFLIHIDRKTDGRTYRRLVRQLGDRPNVHFLTRHTCYWGQFGIVRATNEGIATAIGAGLPFDYLVLLSGQDYPIKTNEQIEDFFGRQGGMAFIHHRPLPKADWPGGGWDRIERWYFPLRGGFLAFPPGRGMPPRGEVPPHERLLRRVPMPKRAFPAALRPFGGSQMWCLARAHVEYLAWFLRRHRRVVDFFRRTYIPDELFFQSILLSSPLRDTIVNECLTYVGYQRPGAVLLADDLGELLGTPHLFARKFDPTVDGTIVDLIDERIGAGAGARAAR